MRMLGAAPVIQAGKGCKLYRTERSVTPANTWIAFIDIFRCFDDGCKKSVLLLQFILEIPQKYLTTIQSIVGCKKNLLKDAMNIYHAKLCWNMHKLLYSVRVYASNSLEMC